MGRRNTITDVESTGLFEITRLRWVDGDYDEGGAYWGHASGEWIYRATDTVHDNECFVRARSLTAAKAAVRETFPRAELTDSAELGSFVSAYVECALWASSADDGTPLDQTEAELSDDVWAAAESDCESFLSEWSVTVEAAGLSIEQAGHDFWLSRNGHGAGFFDRGCGELGDKLQDAARCYGQVDLYMGDDGLIYAC
jgi:hypothetical protein